MISHTMEKRVEAGEYHSKDFQWEFLKNLVENDPSLSHHLHHQEQHRDSSFASPDSQPWQDFHSRHSSGKFFKERRYLLKEFPELVSCEENSKLLEVGCGNGSTVLPILRGSKNIAVYACDCSSEALVRTEENIDLAIASADNFHSFCCDFSKSKFPNWVACDHCRDNFKLKKDRYHSGGSEDIHGNYKCSLNEHCIGGVDFVTLIFTLSAVPKEMMPRAIEECFAVLKPGGLLLFRDYGLYDMTMLRFEPEKRIGFREYVRSDGTLSYFFCLDMVRRLFTDAGFIEVELENCCVKAVNRKKGKTMYRVWVHGKFQKSLIVD
uniref:tRNA N(3)-methylcytidine methyltransferase n=2 Tax=Noccaea caerulescens TaxID=107243 RepID=A0A1J3CK07_NOCCA